MLIVQGTPFYGYHPKPKLFVQIFLYNPRVVTSVVHVLESGSVGEQRFQPYEAHVPFLLQVGIAAQCKINLGEMNSE